MVKQGVKTKVTGDTAGVNPGCWPGARLLSGQVKSGAGGEAAKSEQLTQAPFFPSFPPEQMTVQTVARSQRKCSRSVLSEILRDPLATTHPPPTAKKTVQTGA